MTNNTQHPTQETHPLIPSREGNRTHPLIPSREGNKRGVYNKLNLAEYKINILLVDDQMIVGETVRRMLSEEKDIVFNFCQDPTKAVQLAAEIQPTVILQDLIMPDIDGLTLLKFYRAHSRLKDIPVIVLSTKEEPITKAEAFTIGANDYLVKLPDKIELIARIRYHSRGYINLLERNDAYNALGKKQQELEDELKKTGKYCKALLPKIISNEEIQTEWLFIPSTQLGGDSFGYHKIDDNNFAIYLLDVCGHGAGSALMSVSALNELKRQTLQDTDYRYPSEVLFALNNSFQMADHNDLYFTIWYGVFNNITSELKFSSGGHPPALLISPAGNKKELITDNFIIGGIEDFSFKSSTVKIYKPSTLFVFSDGVYEIELSDGSMWTMNNLFEFLTDNINNEGSVIDLLYRHVIELGSKEILDDDFSMLRIDFR